MRRYLLIASHVALAAAIALPAAAQQSVSAAPRTLATLDNKTTPGTEYDYRRAITYSGTADRYNWAATVSNRVPGVPNTIWSYVVTQGNPRGNGFIASIAYRPDGATPEEKFLFPTTPAGDPVNTSLGGLIDAFAWGAADVVMNQCFGGGFAFNVAGSLQGATSVAGAVIPPVNRIGYTFASGANFDELSFGLALPNGAAGPTTMTGLADFTQSQAWSETTVAGVGPLPLSGAYRVGRNGDPFTVGGIPFGDGVIPGMRNKVPVTGAVPDLQKGFFESPIYGSADAPLASGAPSGLAAAVNNRRTYATGAANRWAVLVAFTADRPEFNLDLQREYAALISDGVPRGHIAVLYGDGTVTGTLDRFTNLGVTNREPDVNAILDTIAAGFKVPFQGGPSNANVAGLLNPDIIVPGMGGRDVWQVLFGTGLGAGTRPVAGNTLMLYVTGHGSAANIKGGELLIANRFVGGVFQTDFKLAGPTNVHITPGTDVPAQITVRGMPQDLAGDIFSINGVAIGPGSLAVVPAGSALDMSGLAGDGSGGTLNYLDLSIPLELFSAMGGSSVFRLSVSNPSYGATEAFQNSFAAYTWLDGPADVCGAGFCDLYTDLVAKVPEPATWFLLISGLGAAGGALRRRRERERGHSLAASC